MNEVAYSTAVFVLAGFYWANRLVATDADGIGNLFAGLGVFLGGVVSLVALINRRTIKEAAASSAEAVAAIGPTDDGATVHDLLTQIALVLEEIGNVLDEIKTFESYQHTRNHDILNALTRLAGSVPVLTSLAQELLTALRDHQTPNTED